MRSEIVVKRLTPELANTYVDYLSSISFEHEPHWATCFCRYYHVACSFDEWVARTGEMNRSEALFEIKGGRMSGYLAFDGEKCIGWCNASDVNEYVRIKNETAPYVRGKKVAGTVCFVIHPDYRGRGVARSILDKAISDYREMGYEAMIAMPFDAVSNPEKRYRGTKNMYFQHGYIEIEKIEDMSIMWLDLKESVQQL